MADCSEALILYQSFPHYPFVQEPHLFLGVEPVLTAFHDGEQGILLFRKAADSLKRRQLVTASIEDPRRHRPVNGVIPYIAEVLPG